MGCLCFGRPLFQRYHWDNFTFARSQTAFNERTSTLKACSNPHIRSYSFSAFARKRSLVPDFRSVKARKKSRSIISTTSGMTEDNFYTPPTGSASGHSGEETYAPPPGPPPSQGQRVSFAPAPHRPGLSSEFYNPPAGPPSYRNTAEIHPPRQGLSPSSASQPVDAPPPYHDWTVIPDTALLPPPPPLGHTSSAVNASAYDAQKGARWCTVHPLSPPRNLSSTEAIALQTPRLTEPLSYDGTLFPLNRHSGTWCARARRLYSQEDTTITTALPLYAVKLHSPLRTKSATTIYFELQLLGYESKNAGVALGFVARPYPHWRLPGWQRGSLAVHSDDGRRYVSDDCGGIDFTAPFREFMRVGLGMRFCLPREGGGNAKSNAAYSQAEAGMLDAEVFFTRDGKMAGGWDVHEERDALQGMGVEGLEGAHDLYAAVGVFGRVKFDVVFNPKDWLYHP